MQQPLPGRGPMVSLRMGQAGPWMTPTQPQGGMQSVHVGMSPQELAGASCHWPTAPRQFEPKLTKFCGERDMTTAELWLRNLGRAASMCNWDSRQALWMAISHLTGLGATWLAGVEAEFTQHPGGPDKGWRHFWFAFHERFVVQNEQLLRKLYDDRVQQAGETVLEYANSLRTLAIKLGLSVDGSDMREKFVRGLGQKQVKARLETVARLIPPSYQGLVEWATDFEARSGRDKAVPESARSIKGEAASFAREIKKLTDNLADVKRKLGIQGELLTKLGRDWVKARQSKLLGQASHIRAAGTNICKARAVLVRCNPGTVGDNSHQAWEPDERYCKDIIPSCAVSLLHQDGADDNLSRGFTMVLQAEKPEEQVTVGPSQQSHTQCEDHNRTQVRLTHQGEIQFVQAVVPDTTTGRQTAAGVRVIHNTRQVPEETWLCTPQGRVLLQRWLRKRGGDDIGLGPACSADKLELPHVQGGSAPSERPVPASWTGFGPGAGDSVHVLVAIPLDSRPNMDLPGSIITKIRVQAMMLVWSKAKLLRHEVSRPRVNIRGDHSHGQ